MAGSADEVRPSEAPATDYNYMGAQEDTIRWVSIALTHVEYPQGDWFGKLLAFSSLAPIAILVAFVSLITFRRDLHTICFFGGTILNEIISLILKYTIKEPRPSKDKDILLSEYGMPSSHSQFMWFFSMYVALFLLLRLYHCNSSSIVENGWKYLSIFAFFLSAFVVSFSRVYLSYHTVEQVVCGGFIGTVFAIFWFFLTQYVFTPLFPTIASWHISEIFMVRDMSLIPNVMWFEYTTLRTESRTRSRKLVSMKTQ